MRVALSLSVIAVSIAIAAAFLTALGMSLREKQASGPPVNAVEVMEKFLGCPLTGETKDGATPTGGLLEENRRKNRFDAPTLCDPSVSLESLLAPGGDEGRWGKTKDRGARVTGYVAMIVPNIAGESCNCYKADDAHTDTHIDLVARAADVSRFDRHLIVEVTPRMKYLARQRGQDWSTAALSKHFLHRKVTVEGWLFWDGGHAREAANTHPRDPEHRNWRATCWEVHPVTGIRLGG